MAPRTIDADKVLDRNHALLFKQLLQNYETKEYKKGIKNADQILKKYPNHGETMAMKGLILTNVDRKDEGWEYVRKGLRNDLKSHICWHVYGLLYRADRNYEESMKCYLNALKFDPDNLVVLRDLAVIQSQLRIFPGLVETRRSLLIRQPDIRGHHTALAVAHHFVKDYAKAEKVLRDYDAKLVVKPKHNPEHSMTTLYLNTVIAESGRPGDALEHLDEIRDQVLDKLELLERQARYQVALQKYEDAAKTYERLLEINSDCHRYYLGLDQAMQFRNQDNVVVSEKIDELAIFYQKLQKRFPRSAAAKRLPLDWLVGEAFKDAADKYLRTLLQKGVPSTFADVKALYKDADKGRVIETLAESYYQELQQSEYNTLDSDVNERTNGEEPINGASNGHTNGKNKEPPTSYLWTLYFLAQSHDLRRNLKRATELIDEALSHTPTLVELHLTKARILKHSGSPRLAAEQMNTARELDLQDRFINTKTTKYYLRADQNGEAINTISLFVNATLGGGAIGDLQEMQSIKFLVEDGLSYERQSLLGLALKRFESVKKAVDQWYEDEFDFHQYCFRKGTIDAYVTSMRWEDTLYRHPVYAAATEGAVRSLLRLHREPALKIGPLENASFSDGDKKKEKKRIQKIRTRCAKDASKEADKKDGVDMHRKIDQDPVGDKLVATTTPLDDALIYLKPWLRDSPNDEHALMLATEVYIEKQEFSQAIQSIRKIDRNSRHYLSYLLESAYREFESQSEELRAEHTEFAQEEFRGAEISEWNARFLASAESTRDLISGLKVGIQSKSMPVEAVENSIFGRALVMTETSIGQAKEIYEMLKCLGSGRVDEYWERIKQVWYNVEA